MTLHGMHSLTQGPDEQNGSAGGGTGDVKGEEVRERGAADTTADGACPESAKILRLQLHHAERTRALILRQFDDFAKDFDARLGEYRSQKAWKLMLAVRVVYSALVRRGIIRAADAVRALLFQPSRREMLLASQELEFPQLSQYLPVEARHSFTEIPYPSNLTDVEDLCDLPIPRRLDIVILAIIDYDFRFQRPQQIAAEFAARGHRVLWISPSRVAPRDSCEDYHALRIQENLWEIRLKSPALDIYRDQPDEATTQAQLSSLLNVLRAMEVAGHVLIVQIPFWRRLALALRKRLHSSLVYDCMDDWSAFENISGFIRTEEAMLAREADLVIASASKLMTKFEGQAARTMLVRNGAAYEHFQGAEPHPDLHGVAHPIIGYYGAIADWIDLKLVEESARRRPQYSFVLVGQVFGRDVRPLKKLPNVYLMGGRPYSEIPKFLASFDVGTIPFLINEVTEATDPVKLYEYLCSGKPVVATRMGELGYMGNAVYLADSASQYVEFLDRAVVESSPTLAEERRRIAKSSTWAQRVDPISSQLAQMSKRTSILVVTYQSAAYIELCLESILTYTESLNYEVIVADNASTDGTADIASRFEKAGGPVRVIRFTQNHGFAGGNNRAAKAASGSHLVLLNPDTMMTPGWLARLRWHLEDDPTIGLVCPVTNFAGNEARIEADYRCAVEMELFSRRRSKEFLRQRSILPMAPLFCAMLETDLFREVGGLDESYGIGMFEDDDLSQKLLHKQRSIVCAEDCFVHHFGQGSFGALQPSEYEAAFRKNRETYERRWKTTWTPHAPREGTRPVSFAKRYEPGVFAVEWAKLLGLRPRSSASVGHRI